MVRRTAARGLHDFGTQAKPALVAALRHADAEVRRTAFLSLNALGAMEIEYLAVAIRDKDNTAMRLSAAQIAAQMPPSQKTRTLLEIAASDEAETVREVASKALNPFPFFRKVRSIRDHADQIVTVVQTIPLPSDGWKLKFDPRQEGHVAKWFDPVLDEADWTSVSIGKCWDDFGFTNRTGIGWYRGRVVLPGKPAMNAVELSFDGVDEAAWVWVNGEYAGQHDVGPTGGGVPFRIDVTPFLNWDAENHAAVRVLNTAKAGGIGKPVNLEVIKLGN